jgi:hypothetical protein
MKPDQTQIEWQCLPVPEFRDRPKRMPHSAHRLERNVHTGLGRPRIPARLPKISSRNTVYCAESREKTDHRNGYYRLVRMTNCVPNKSRGSSFNRGRDLGADCTSYGRIKSSQNLRFGVPAFVASVSRTLDTTNLPPRQAPLGSWGLCRPSPSMRRPISVKSVFLFLTSGFLRLRRLCRHPSIRTLL